MLGSVLLSSLKILGSNFNDTRVDNDIKVSSPVEEVIFVHCGHTSDNKIIIIITLVFMHP